MLRAFLVHPTTARQHLSSITSPATSTLSLARKMSNAALSQLPAPIRELVEGTQGKETQTGLSQADQTAVDGWLSKVGTEPLNEGALKELDATLSSRTYLVGNNTTAADIALYGALHPLMSTLSASAYYAHPSVTRYFDHIQNLSNVRTFSTAPALVEINLDNAPKIERKAEPPKKKVKKESEASPAAAPVAKDQGPAKEKEKKEKKAKKEPTGAATQPSGGKKAAAASTAPAAAADSGEPSPSMIDLRVGRIVDVKVHPDADGLYVEQIDVGEEAPRTIVSGLVKYVPIEQMRNKYLIVVANLKPANMRGVKSAGMVLCATSKDGKEAGIEVLGPPEGSKPGDRVFFEGEQYESAQPLSQMNPKKKIFETIQPGFITLNSREAAWVDPKTQTTHRIMTKLGPCTAPTLVGASLS